MVPASALFSLLEIRFVNKTSAVRFAEIVKQALLIVWAESENFCMPCFGQTYGDMRGPVAEIRTTRTDVHRLIYPNARVSTNCNYF
jgi:hypothetical protein